jgi:tryptophanyl-tRNA synthetase
MSKQRALSGIQTSGTLHLGNYLGALRRFVELQDTYDTYYFLADLHSITAPQDPESLRLNITNVAATYIGCGLDPQRATLFRQSDVAAHAELGWILTTLTTMGELRRMTQFKDKSGTAKEESVGVGLFTYPSLMAADILLYQPEVVPVGADQKQHVELTRDLAERFNNRFGETFVIPKPLIAEEGARIMGLDDPTKKMSKSAASEYNYISLIDSPDEIAKKIRKAVTDSGEKIELSDDKPAIKNLLTIYALLQDRMPAEVTEEFLGKGYGDFKNALTEVILEALGPIRDRIMELTDDPAEVNRILRDGAERAEAQATKTLASVKQRMGLA